MDIMEVDEVVATEADYITNLDEALLAYVFSCLETAQAIAKCAPVCRRWRIACTQVQRLVFCESELTTPHDFEAIVTSTLLRTAALKELQISCAVASENEDDDPPGPSQTSAGLGPVLPAYTFTEGALTTWLEHLSPSLEALTIWDRGQPSHNQRLEKLSLCPKLSSLVLSHGKLADGLHPPPGSFGSLTSLTLAQGMSLTDSSVAAILAACPALETFRLLKVKGLRQLVLTSKTLTRLEVHSLVDYSQCTYHAELRVHAPNLKELLVEGVENVSVDGGLPIPEAGDSVRGLAPLPCSKLAVLQVVPLSTLDVQWVRSRRLIAGRLLWVGAARLKSRQEVRVAGGSDVKLQELRLGAHDLHWPLQRLLQLLQTWGGPELQVLKLDMVCHHTVTEGDTEDPPLAPLLITELLGGFEALQSVSLGRGIMQSVINGWSQGGRSAAGGLELPRLRSVELDLGRPSRAAAELLRLLCQKCPLLQSVKVKAEKMGTVSYATADLNHHFFDDLLQLQRQYPWKQVSVTCPELLTEPLREEPV